MAKSRRATGGEQLVALMDEKGMSRGDLCAKLEVSEAAVCRWISGSRTPSLEMALKLERELGILAEDWLIGHARSA